MDELFNNLLDISKLDALVLTPAVTDFPIAHLLKRTESTFAATAHKNGLSFRIVSNSAWVRSDPILLERILLNLVSNAVANTVSGGIVIGCRRRGAQLRIQGVGQRARHSGGSAPEHLRRVSSTRRPPA
jgi:signal transduction histidine kinase